MGLSDIEYKKDLFEVVVVRLPDKIQDDELNLNFR